jgi:TolA-binding protein
MPGIVRSSIAAVIAAALSISFTSVADAAQQSSAVSGAVTTADIQRLQDEVYLTERDVAQLRTRDATRADLLQSELDDLRDEVVYLKVKLRKERTLTRTEYADVRQRIEGVRSRARITASTSAAPSPGPPRSESPSPAPAAVQPALPSPAHTARTTSPDADVAPSSRRASASTVIELPAGTEFDVRLQSVLDSGTAQVEDRFEATTLVDVIVGERTVVPAGSVARGMVTAVEPATRTNRTAKMTVVFDELVVNGRTTEIRGTVTEAIEGSGIKGEAIRIGAGAGVGAIIGGIIGGAKGALAGVLIGGGGTIAATEGKEVELPQGSVLRVRIDSPVEIRAAR